MGRAWAPRLTRYLRATGRHGAVVFDGAPYRLISKSCAGPAGCHGAGGAAFSIGLAERFVRRLSKPYRWDERSTHVAAVASARKRAHQRARAVLRRDRRRRATALLATAASGRARSASATASSGFSKTPPTSPRYAAWHSAWHRHAVRRHAQPPWQTTWLLPHQVLGTSIHLAAASLTQAARQFSFLHVAAALRTLRTRSSVLWKLRKPPGKSAQPTLQPTFSYGRGWSDGGDGTPLVPRAAPRASSLFARGSATRGRS